MPHSTLPHHVQDKVETPDHSLAQEHLPQHLEEVFARAIGNRTALELQLFGRHNIPAGLPAWVLRELLGEIHCPLHGAAPLCIRHKRCGLRGKRRFRLLVVVLRTKILVLQYSMFGLGFDGYPSADASGTIASSAMAVSGRHCRSLRTCSNRRSADCSAARSPIRLSCSCSGKFRWKPCDRPSRVCAQRFRLPA